MQIKINDENDLEFELVNIPGEISGEGLKRSKRCINSLDRSASRSSSRMSRSRNSKSPSVASQEDYNEWFNKFDNHLSGNLEVPEPDDDEFESDVEEDFLMDVNDGNLNGADICKIDDEESRDVSVSVTLNLKKSPGPAVECFPCADFQQDRKVYKTKGEEFLELERFREQQSRRRVSIVPTTEEEHQKFVSILHPEDFTPQADETEKTPHEHHEHLHNVGYSEWMKKVVDHHSSHLATSDSDSDSDVSLDEVRMLPLFRADKKKKRKGKWEKRIATCDMIFVNGRSLISNETLRFKWLVAVKAFFLSSFSFFLADVNKVWFASKSRLAFPDFFQLLVVFWLARDLICHHRILVGRHEKAFE